MLVALIPDGYLATLDKQLDTVDGTLKCYVSPPLPGDKKRFEHEIQGPSIKKLCENIEQQFPDVELLEAFTLFDPSKLPRSLTKQLNLTLAMTRLTFLANILILFTPLL